MLSGMRIIEEHCKGNIIFEPFRIEQVNPNSYNIRLTDELMIYDMDKCGGVLDMKKNNPTKILKIPEEGLVLEPGTLYLGRTYEYTETYGFVPVIDGRSSVGRLGISVHITAGFGDDGFQGYWTLEITTVHPIRVYPNVQIGQVYFHTIERATNEKENERNYIGKYQDNDGIQASMMYKELT